MVGQVVGQVYGLVSAPLRRHDNTPDLLHLRVVRWAHSIKVTGDLQGRGAQLAVRTASQSDVSNSSLPPTDLSAEIRDDNELFQDILWKDVCEASLLDVIRRHVDVVSSQVEVSGRDGSHSPLCLTGEGSRLVVTGGGSDDLISML